jgi:ferrochelatase
MRGVILLNMGGINSLNEVELFLNNMFADPNILTIKNRFFRSLIAKLIIFRRKSKVIENYKKIGGKSPLKDLTKELVSKVQQSLPEDFVTYAMRYTPEYEIDALKECINRGVKSLVIIPLYPQYSTTTTKSSLEAMNRAISQLNFQGSVKIIDRFYENRLYNLGVVDRIKEALGNKKALNFDLIFSAHSLPQKIIDAGDCYEIEIKKNVEILKYLLSANGINFNKIHLAYQSKVTPIKWLEPSLEKVLESIENKRVIIYPISFIIDNSETVFELLIEYKELSDKLGFEEFIVSKALNSSDLFVNSLLELIDS